MVYNKKKQVYIILHNNTIQIHCKCVLLILKVGLLIMSTKPNCRQLNLTVIPRGAKQGGLGGSQPPLNFEGGGGLNTCQPPVILGKFF